MSDEAAFIALLRTVAIHPAARGLMDDAALFVPPAGRALVLTHDMLVEGVHFLRSDPPEDVAWKLVAVNLSDLAAKGARPEGMMLGYMLGPDRNWDACFVDGLARVSARFGIPLLGGDTVSGSGGPRALGLTAIGSVSPGGAPPRTSARPGDGLWVTGTIGNAGLGLALAMAGETEPAELLAAYRRPHPRSVEGERLVPHAHAGADVSDGLLIDARRMAEASGCAVTVALDLVPMSAAAIARAGDGETARLAAATAGDDYELLLAMAPDRAADAVAAAATLGLRLTRIGTFVEGIGLNATMDGRRIVLPTRLGYEHAATNGPGAS